MFDELELIEEMLLDGVSLGTCKDCGEIEIEVEPDQAHGYCPNCGGRNVVSILIQEGLI